jgi:hypothetical protein
VLTIALVASLLAFALFSGRLYIPPEWSPWVALDLNAPS